MQSRLQRKKKIGDSLDRLRIRWDSTQGLHSTWQLSMEGGTHGCHHPIQCTLQQPELSHPPSIYLSLVGEGKVGAEEDISYT